MSKYDNNQILRDLMSDCNLRHKDIADLLVSEYGSTPQRSIEAWIYDRSPLAGPILELITLKLGALVKQQPDKS